MEKNLSIFHSIDRSIIKWLEVDKFEVIAKLKIKHPSVQIYLPNEQGDIDKVKLVSNDRKKLNLCRDDLHDALKRIYPRNTKKTSFKSNIYRGPHCTVNVKIPSEIMKFFVGSTGESLKQFIEKAENKFDIIIKKDKNGSGKHIVKLKGDADNLQFVKEGATKIFSEYSSHSHIKVDYKTYGILYKCYRNSMVKVIEETTQVHMIVMDKPSGDKEKQGQGKHKPNYEDSDTKSIFIIGNEAGVIMAKDEIDKLIDNVKNFDEENLNIEQNFFNYFCGHDEIKMKLNEECGDDVVIKFPTRKKLSFINIKGKFRIYYPNYPKNKNLITKSY